MKPIDKKLYSRVAPIAHIRSLASCLSVAEEDLVKISSAIYELWRPGMKLKKRNGEIRHTVDATDPLKFIHEKIKNRLLKKVHYPQYLLGGIPNDFFQRDYKRHALIHAGKKYLINEDVKDFFPNTSTAIVKSIWQHFFNFSPDVSTMLANLTTLDNALPQGWKTSSYLANLAFWKREGKLVDDFCMRGIAYSRFMDDISVSTNYKLDTEQKKYIIGAIYAMLFASGYAPRREKHEILSAAKRMHVTNLNVNAKNPTLPKKERDKIRAAVYECEQHAQYDRVSFKYRKRWNSTSGKVGQLKRFHHDEAEKLRERLTEIKPR